jgi:hypothetical protein
MRALITEAGVRSSVWSIRSLVAGLLAAQPVMRGNYAPLPGTIGGRSCV